MTESAVPQQVYRYFSEMLDYPGSGLIESVKKCETTIGSQNSEIGKHLRKFKNFVEETSLEKIKEVYIDIFDMVDSYNLYVGYHLFGESYKRSAFMVGIKENYKTENFSAKENELPDHLSIMIGFMAICKDKNLTDEIAAEAIMPILDKMFKKKKEAEEPMAEEPVAEECGNKDKDLEDDRVDEVKMKNQRTNPYVHVLKALRLVFQQQYPMVKVEEVKNHV